MIARSGCGWGNAVRSQRLQKGQTVENTINQNPKAQTKLEHCAGRSELTMAGKPTAVSVVAARGVCSARK